MSSGWSYVAHPLISGTYQIRDENKRPLGLAISRRAAEEICSRRPSLFEIQDALAALRPETRELMIEELRKAHADTLDEYLELESKDLKSKLMGELASIEEFLKEVRKVSEEYSEIERRKVQK